MLIGTNWICSSWSRKSLLWPTWVVLTEELWAGTPHKCSVFDWLSNVSPTNWGRITETSNWCFFSSISVWSENNTVNYLTHHSSSSSISFKWIVQGFATAAQLPTIIPAVKAKNKKFLSTLCCLTSSHYLTLSPLPRVSCFHRRDAHRKSSRQIPRSSLNKGSPCSCQTSPPVYLLCEFGFYGTSGSVVFWIRITPARSSCWPRGWQGWADTVSARQWYRVYTWLTRAAP